MAMAKRSKESYAWVRTFEVTEPTRHRKGFTVYKVTSTVFPKSFPESATKITVWKRYSDFRKLHTELEQIFKQLYLKGEFPAFPKAKVFGRFEHEVIEERRTAALVLLEFTATQTQLFTSKTFIQFFQNGYKSDEFIGRILFRQNSQGNEEPPTTAVEERADIGVPCLEPEKLWDSNLKSANDDDSVSLSLSSVSSSLSPDTPLPLVSSPGHNGDGDRMPCSPTSAVSEEKVCGNGSGANGTSAYAESVTDSVASTEIASSSGMNASQTSSHANSSSLVLSSQSEIVVIDEPNKMSSKSCSSRGNGIVRSATVTDDLSAYFEDEFEDAAFLFPAGSCASLDALPGFTPSSDDADSVHSRVSATSNRTGLFTLPKNKNGFGLFDFLPLFPKKSKKKQEKSKEKEKAQEEKKDLLSVGYICEAAGHFAVAQFHESNTEYQDAFTAYKEGIRVLLAGAQSDSDRDRKTLAKNKLEKYLSRAESLKDMYLSPDVLNEGTGAISPVFSSPSRKEKYLSSLNKSGIPSHHSISGLSLLSNLEELKMFKVVGRSTWKSSVLIVMNPEEPAPKCYAAKVLWKSACIVFPNKPTIVPCHVPFMARLLKWFETSDKIVLLLEYVGGGRLVDFVTNYQSKRISFVTPPDESTPADEQPPTKIGSETPVGDNNSNTNGIDQIEESASSSFNARKSEAISKVIVEDPELINASESSCSGLSIGNNIEDDTRLDTPTPIDTSCSMQTTCDSCMHESDNVNETFAPDNLEISKLLENSKALLQTVTKTLEEGSSPRKLSKSSLQRQESIEITDVGHHEPLGSETSVQRVANIENEETNTCQGHPDSIRLEAENDIANEAPSKDTAIEDLEEPVNPKRMVPDGCIRVWAAEMVIALEALHDVGITYGDLDINDIFLGENGHITLRYKSLWKEVDDPVSISFYTAPEVRYAIGVPLWEIHPSADWWSLGAILFLLFTGQCFNSVHPEGIFPEMIIKVPDTAVDGSPISRSVQQLLSELLQFTPELRLGFYGAAEIKTHPFFEGFDWDKATEDITDQ